MVKVIETTQCWIARDFLKQLSDKNFFGMANKKIGGRNIELIKIHAIGSNGKDSLLKSNEILLLEKLLYQRLIDGNTYANQKTHIEVVATKVESRDRQSWLITENPLPGTNVCQLHPNEMQELKVSNNQPVGFGKIVVCCAYGIENKQYFFIG